MLEQLSDNIRRNPSLINKTCNYKIKINFLQRRQKIIQFFLSNVLLLLAYNVSSVTRIEFSYEKLNDIISHVLCGKYFWTSGWSVLLVFLASFLLWLLSMYLENQEIKLEISWGKQIFKNFLDILIPLIFFFGLSEILAWIIFISVTGNIPTVVINIANCEISVKNVIQDITTLPSLRELLFGTASIIFKATNPFMKESISSILSLATLILILYSLYKWFESIFVDLTNVVRIFICFIGAIYLSISPSGYPNIQKGEFFILILLAAYSIQSLVDLLKLYHHFQLYSKAQKEPLQDLG